jgi:hypothetical protein
MLAASSAAELEPRRAPPPGIDGPTLVGRLKLPHPQPLQTLATDLLAAVNHEYDGKRHC